KVRRAVGDDAHRRARALLDDRSGDVLTGRLELAREAVHVVLVVVGPLRVRRPLGVARTPGEIRRRGVVDGTRKRPVSNPIAVYVPVTSKLLEPADVLLQFVFGPDDFPAVDSLFGIGK